jgi:lipopolysaccharide/colanic/teichoic acid biosynthesis glycosyltransferase
VPQILNVLRGEMSLVGPRPTSFAASTYDLWHTERLEVLPGITGLWQVSGRSDIDFDDRVRLDIEYLERRSFGFDLVILLRTVAALVQQRGAY